MTDYCSKDEVKKRRGGDDPAGAISDHWDDVIAAKCTEVSRDLDRMIGNVRGFIHGPYAIVAEAEPSERIYTAPDGGSGFMAIDDCITTPTVGMTLDPGGSETELVEGVDFRLVRSSGAIVALRRIGGPWAPFPAAYAVSSRWGLAAATPVDVREAAIIEVIRSFLGDRAGNDDRLGMTPFGQVVTSKAFVSKTNRLVSDYRYGGASLRVPN